MKERQPNQQNAQWNKQKVTNHLDNIQHLDGVFFHGTYFLKGVAQINKKQQAKRGSA